MKLLTLVSAIFLPGALIAGVMGMNSRVPLFEHVVGFWAVIGVIAAIGVGRRRGAPAQLDLIVVSPREAPPPWQRDHQPGAAGGGRSAGAVGAARAHREGADTGPPPGTPFVLLGGVALVIWTAVALVAAAAPSLWLI